MRGSHEPRSSSSCAACKLLKRRCTPTCIFAPYFRSDEPKKFAKVHKVFGASNVSKILIEVPEEQREDTVNSLAYEAEARLQDPVYGCIGAIALLQRRMAELQRDLAIARARLARFAVINNNNNHHQHHNNNNNQCFSSSSSNSNCGYSSYSVVLDHVRGNEVGLSSGGGGGGGGAMPCVGLSDGFGQISPLLEFGQINSGVYDYGSFVPYIL